MIPMDTIKTRLVTQVTRDLMHASIFLFIDYQIIGFLFVGLFMCTLYLFNCLFFPFLFRPSPQVANNPRAYKGVRDCFSRVLREEGVGAFYRSLPPRLMSVVPMIAIQVNDPNPNPAPPCPSTPIVSTLCA